MYEALVGFPPFDGADAFSVGYKHVHEKPVPIGEVDSRVPEALAAIVMRCLEKAASDRYERGTALADALIAYLAEAPARRPERTVARCCRASARPRCAHEALARDHRRPHEAPVHHRARRSERVPRRARDGDGRRRPDGLGRGGAEQHLRRDGGHGGERDARARAGARRMPTAGRSRRWSRRWRRRSASTRRHAPR